MDFTWIESSACAGIPPNAVFAGQDSDDEIIFVGRANYAGYTMPAKIIPNKRTAYVCHNGKEISLENYEYLCCKEYAWVASRGEMVPPRAISGGQATDGEHLYIGRGNYGSSLSIGKIRPSHKCLYVPCGGTERRLDHYGYLVAIDAWIKLSDGIDLPPGAVCAGNNDDGAGMYVGRAYHEGNLVPAKIVYYGNTYYTAIAHNGQEIKKNEFEILCGSGFTWIASACGNVPKGAFAGGYTVTGETLYIGRGHYKGGVTVGKVQPSHGCLQLPHGRGENSILKYEILVHNYLYIGLNQYEQNLTSEKVHKAHGCLYLPHSDGKRHSNCYESMVSIDTWIKSADGIDIPQDAVFAGNDSDGSEMYIGRAYHEGNLVPAKIIPAYQATYISHKGKVIRKHAYEILCGNGFVWVPCSRGNVPRGAVPGGKTVCGEILYIGRGKYLETLQPGKIQPSHGCLQLAHGTGEHGLSEYEVLARKCC